MKNVVNRVIKKVYIGIYTKVPLNVKRGINRIVKVGLRLKKMSFEIHLVEHCNLNCKGCDNYSPIACEDYVETVAFRNQMRQMRRIFGINGISEVRFLGGEPLLHPQICELLEEARKILPRTKLTIITNGLLLPKMGNRFLDVCSDNRIQILVTKYPVNFDYVKVLEAYRNRGIECGVFNTDSVKTLFKKPLDTKGNCDRKKMFELCLNANHCIVLKDGRLYTCSTIPNVCHLNNYFGTLFDVTEDDSIDIFKVTDKKRIRKFLSRSVPFCKYCDIEHEQFGIKWEVSKKSLSEWV